ncbi:alpha/beta fold hydrolase [Microbacterium sp. 179-B 1A2 NHS]|uniref:alpha/beta fold hydrolase n=1 Tax=Microbacterium sp. 179-B 1A2 NHS TaxID=3142383 RepID=UPI0039A20FC3
MTDLPADTVHERFTVDGAQIVAESAGDPAARVTFLLVHGIGMGRRVFGDLVSRLAPHGFCIAIDLPGYGEAPEPARTPTIERMADIVAAYLRRTDRGPVVLVGHSMGTQVVVEIAVRHPELASHVVLVAPTVDRRARHPLTQFLRLAADVVGESPKVIWLGAREYLRAGPNLRGKVRSAFSHRPERVYPDVRVPALVIRGGKDRVSPRRWCDEVASLLPDARRSTVPGHGHETLIDDATPAAREIVRLVTG